MSNLSVEVLNFREPDVHAQAAARLLQEECRETMVAQDVKAESDEQEHRLFLSGYSHPGVTIYGLLNKGEGILAAASVLHGWMAVREPTARITHLAVHPDARRHGHGTRLVRHIAEQAIAKGNRYVRYDANHTYTERPDEYGFLMSFPIEEVMERVMRADAAEVLL